MPVTVRAAVGLALATLAVMPGRAASGVLVCHVGATPLNFGVVEVLQGTPTDVAVTLEVTCINPGPAAVPVTLSLSPLGGAAPEGRRMGPAAGLRYQLFTNPARTIPWGDGTSGTAALTASDVVLPGMPLRRRLTVYGRVHPRQSGAAVASYLDTLSVMLTY